MAKCKTTQNFGFHPQKRRGLVVLVKSVDELVYVFPQTRVNDFVISVFSRNTTNNIYVNI